MLPNGDKVLQETHDGNKRNANNDFRDSNLGFNTNHIPKINTRKFDRVYISTFIHIERKIFS